MRTLEERLNRDIPPYIGFSTALEATRAVLEALIADLKENEPSLDLTREWLEAAHHYTPINLEAVRQLDKERSKR